MSDNIQELISVKAEELFNLCDKEQKGFIIKKDMQHLRDELGVESEQLEDVFDSLDIDHNGFLTLEEFTSGFGMFLSNQIANMNDNEQEEFVEHNLNDKEEERQVFHETLEALGAKDLYDDEETIMGLWMKLRETDPSLLRQFEQFIGKVTEEMKRSKLDHRSIEAALQSKSTVYNDEFDHQHPVRLVHVTHHREQLILVLIQVIEFINRWLYYLSSSYWILDHHTIIMNLSTTNTYNRTIFLDEYAVRDAYEMGNSFPNDWHNLIQRLKNDIDGSLIDLVCPYFTKSYANGSQCHHKCRRGL